MKKSLITLLACTLLIGGLSACSNNSSVALPINGTITDVDTKQENLFEYFFGLDYIQYDSLSLDENDEGSFISMNFYDPVDYQLYHETVKLNSDEVETCENLMNEFNEDKTKEFLCNIENDRIEDESISDYLPEALRLRIYSYRFNEAFKDGYEYNTYYEEDNNFYIIFTKTLDLVSEYANLEYNVYLSLKITATYNLNQKIDNEDILNYELEQYGLANIYATSIKFDGIKWEK